jgi:hypothetical protein
MDINILAIDTISLPDTCDFERFPHHREGLDHQTVPRFFTKAIHWKHLLNSSFPKLSVGFLAKTCQIQTFPEVVLDYSPTKKHIYIYRQYANKIQLVHGSILPLNRRWTGDNPLFLGGPACKTQITIGPLVNNMVGEKSHCIPLCHQFYHHIHCWYPFGWYIDYF